MIDSIVADIANCTNEQQALNMAAEAFGTMAEDGNLKFITSLTSVGETYDSVAGSAQNLFDQTGTPMQEMEANTRKLQQALIPLGEKIVELANVVLPPLVAVIETVSEIFGMLPEPVQNFVVILGALLVAFTALTPVIAALSGGIRGAQYLSAPGNRHHCRSGCGHCRDHSYCEKLGRDHGMVRPALGDGIRKADGTLGQGGGVLHGNHPCGGAGVYRLLLRYPSMVEQPVVAGFSIFRQYLEQYQEYSRTGLERH